MSFQPVSDPLMSPDYMEDININNNDEEENISKITHKNSEFDNNDDFPQKPNLPQSAGNQIDCSFITPPEPNIKKLLKTADINSLAEYGIDTRDRVHCCDLLDNIFKQENYNDYTIEITQAEKINDFFGSSYIVYTIQAIKKDGHKILFETKRRYSEFDMLQKHLIARFPTLIVPPIPGKSNIIEYATGSGKNQKDTMVEKRKRMLQTFLNRLRNHPVFSCMHIVHLFIQPGAQWSSKQDIIEIKEGTDKIVSCIDEPRLAIIKDKLTLCLKYITAMYNIQSEACKNLQELSILYSNSGEIYNCWSMEREPYAPILDQFRKAGEAFYAKLQSILQTMDNYIVDILVQYIRYVEIAFGVCKAYRNKYLRFQQISQQLDNKRNYLKHMENGNAHEPSAEPTGGIGIENNILRFKSTINSFIDNDPVITHQKNITNTKDIIGQLEQDQESQLRLLAIASLQVDTDIQRFEKERKDDFINMFKQYAIIHRDLDSFKYEFWSTVKSQISS
ncbi:hypothetical protein BCR36DRAFT_317831 [Piromyces finnis]|uniref:PX domain-containing protein n=1 Tax=Piromyces finnis TaxID=1754191 RepID=A0A1Y1VK45_9FUNG|nr:hypothetical protein BCR36DRAFT_317831 [Piromyces finnis]|eukprot:ORX58453.1 hypothetical protein BCR36DRAFT_317831 [Piromyces finnis]